MTRAALGDRHFDLFGNHHHTPIDGNGGAQQNTGVGLDIRGVKRQHKAERCLLTLGTHDSLRDNLGRGIGDSGIG